MSKTVLIVDDSRMSRMMISTIIKKHHPDWSIIDAASGDEALEKAEGRNINLMTLDMNMPGMDGITLGTRLRSLFPQANIALLTTSIQEAAKHNAEQAELSFIAKPITEDRIMDYIDSTESA